MGDFFINRYLVKSIDYSSDNNANYVFWKDIFKISDKIILLGEPATGKTYILKKLYEEHKNNSVFIDLKRFKDKIEDCINIEDIYKIDESTIYIIDSIDEGIYVSDITLLVKLEHFLRNKKYVIMSCREYIWVNENKQTYFNDFIEYKLVDVTLNDMQDGLDVTDKITLQDYISKYNLKEFLKNIFIVNEIRQNTISKNLKSDFYSLYWNISKKLLQKNIFEESSNKKDELFKTSNLSVLQDVSCFIAFYTTIKTQTELSDKEFLYELITLIGKYEISPNQLDMLLESSLFKLNGNKKISFINFDIQDFLCAKYINDKKIDIKKFLDEFSVESVLYPKYETMLCYYFMINNNDEKLFELFLEKDFYIFKTCPNLSKEHKLRLFNKIIKELNDYPYKHRKERISNISNSYLVKNYSELKDDITVIIRNTIKKFNGKKDNFILYRYLHYLVINNNITSLDSEFFNYFKKFIKNQNKLNPLTYDYYGFLIDLVCKNDNITIAVELAKMYNTLGETNRLTSWDLQELFNYLFSKFVKKEIGFNDIFPLLNEEIIYFLKKDDLKNQLNYFSIDELIQIFEKISNNTKNRYRYKKEESIPALLFTVFDRFNEITETNEILQKLSKNLNRLVTRKGDYEINNEFLLWKLIDFHFKDDKYHSPFYYFDFKINTDLASRIKSQLTEKLSSYDFNNNRYKYEIIGFYEYFSDALKSEYDKYMENRKAEIEKNSQKYKEIEETRKNNTEIKLNKLIDELYDNSSYEYLHKVCVEIIGTSLTYSNYDFSPFIKNLKDILKEKFDTLKKIIHNEFIKTVYSDTHSLIMFHAYFSEEINNIEVDSETLFKRIAFVELKLNQYESWFLELTKQYQKAFIDVLTNIEYFLKTNNDESIYYDSYRFSFLNYKQDNYRKHKYIYVFDDMYKDYFFKQIKKVYETFPNTSTEVKSIILKILSIDESNYDYILNELEKDKNFDFFEPLYLCNRNEAIIYFFKNPDYIKDKEILKKFFNTILNCDYNDFKRTISDYFFTIDYNLIKKIIDIAYNSFENPYIVGMHSYEFEEYLFDMVEAIIQKLTKDGNYKFINDSEKTYHWYQQGLYNWITLNKLKKLDLTKILNTETENNKPKKNNTNYNDIESSSINIEKNVENINVYYSKLERLSLFKIINDEFISIYQELLIFEKEYYIPSPKIISYSENILKRNLNFAFENFIENCDVKYFGILAFLLRNSLVDLAVIYGNKTLRLIEKFDEIEFDKLDENSKKEWFEFALCILKTERYEGIYELFQKAKNRITEKNNIPEYIKNEVIYEEIIFHLIKFDYKKVFELIKQWNFDEEDKLNVKLLIKKAYVLSSIKIKEEEKYESLELIKKAYDLLKDTCTQEELWVDEMLLFYEYSNFLDKDKNILSKIDELKSKGFYSIETTRDYLLTFDNDDSDEITPLENTRYKVSKQNNSTENNQSFYNSLKFIQLSLNIGISYKLQINYPVTYLTESNFYKMFKIIYTTIPQLISFFSYSYIGRDLEEKFVRGLFQKIVNSNEIDNSIKQNIFNNFVKLYEFFFNEYGFQVFMIIQIIADFFECLDYEIWKDFFNKYIITLPFERFTEPVNSTYITAKSLPYIKDDESILKILNKIIEDNIQRKNRDIFLFQLLSEKDVENLKRLYNNIKSQLNSLLQNKNFNGNNLFIFVLFKDITDDDLKEQLFKKITEIDVKTYKYDLENVIKFLSNTAVKEKIKKYLLSINNIFNPEGSINRKSFIPINIFINNNPIYLEWNSDEILEFYNHAKTVINEVNKLINSGSRLIVNIFTVRNIILFLKNHSELLNKESDYKELMDKIKENFKLLKEFDSIQDGLTSTSERSILMALGELKDYFIDNPTEENMMYWNLLLIKILKAENPKLEYSLEILSGLLLYVLKGQKWPKKYKEYYLEILKKYQKISFDNLDRNFVELQLIKIATALKNNFKIKDNVVEYWLDIQKNSEFNKVKYFKPIN